MISLRKPAAIEIQQFLERQSRLPYSYANVGGTRPTFQQRDLPGYVIDHNRVQLGTGPAVFAQAKAAIQCWQMFNLGWVQLYWPHAPITVGTTVGVLANPFGFWSLNACRIVYLIDETVAEVDTAIERYGFAYGTLPDHVERGEERFMVEWRQADNTVWYDILAFSHPQQWLAKVGYPVVRQYQKQFARDSKRAMLNR
ncbi:MAG: DUF1990 domain-containing protein [Chloroflexi bacterium]|nr:DUF1990 domain-containing protein [Chloroflexota bacterium]